MIKPVAPACDPGIPPVARQRLARSRSMLYDPEAPSKAPVFQAKPWAHAIPWVSFYSLSFTLGVITAVNFTGAWQLIAWIWASFFGLSSTAAAILLAVRARDCAFARRHRGRFIDLIDLEASSRHLLLRAQQAIAVVLGSAVHSHDLLDKAANEVILRQNEWEIAATLCRIRALRAKAARGDPPGPMSAAVAASQARVLDLAQDGVTGRLQALERYAAQVKVADDAYHDYQHALTLAALNDEHLELLARTTVAGKQAIAEISDLGRQAVAARQALCDSLIQASQAAQILTLLPTRCDASVSSQDVSGLSAETATPGGQPAAQGPLKPANQAPHHEA